MRAQLAIAAALTLAALSGRAIAAPTDTPAPAVSTNVPATATAPSADDDKIVCKSIAVTGTRFPTQTCHTKREWADIAQAAKDFTNKLTTGPCTGPTCHGN